MGEPVARMEETINPYKLCVGNLKVRDHSEDLCVDRRIILQWILRKWVGKVWTGFIWVMIGTGGWLLWAR